MGDKIIQRGGRDMYKTLIYNGQEFRDIEINEFGDMRNARTGWTYVWYETNRGYNYTLVHIGKDHKKRILQHRAVAGTFVENEFNKPQINHIDGDKKNNHISNLEWCTAKENNDHAWRTGLSRCHSGEEMGLAKLNREQVMFIVDNYKAKSRTKGATALAKILNVNRSLVTSVTCGQSWVKFVKEYRNERLQA